MSTFPFDEDDRFNRMLAMRMKSVSSSQLSIKCHFVLMALFNCSNVVTAMFTLNIKTLKAMTVSSIYLIF